MQAIQIENENTIPLRPANNGSGLTARQIYVLSEIRKTVRPFNVLHQLLRLEQPALLETLNELIALNIIEQTNHPVMGYRFPLFEN